MSIDPWAEPVRGLVLDVDDTLLDTRAAMSAAGVAAAAAAWPGHPGEVHEELSARFYADPGGHFDAYTRGEQTFEEQRRARYDVALAALRLRGGDEFATYELAYARAFTGVQVLFDDVETLLGTAADHGVAVCLLTNSSAEQTDLKLDAIGWRGRFPVVTTDTLGVGKPDPRIYAAACDLAGTPPHTTVCIGDTLDTDVRGARAAGLRAAWLQRADRPAPRNSGWGTPIDDPGVRVIPSLIDAAAWLRG